MARKKKTIVDDIYFMMRDVNSDSLFSKLDQLTDLEVTDRDGRTVLINAAFCGRMDVIHRLISRGANVNASDCNGFTALLAAVQEQNIPMVEYLLSVGADIHAQNIHGNSVLMIPNNDCPEQLWRILLSHGADPHKKNNYGISAADLWQTGNGPEFLKSYI